MLAGVQPAVGGDAASAVEASDRLERVHHGQRGLQAHAGMGAQPHHARVGGGARGQLLVDGCDLRLQCRQQNLRLLPLGGISAAQGQDRKSTRLNSSHSQISYAVFCLKKKKNAASTDASSDTGAMSVSA